MTLVSPSIHLASPRTITFLASLGGLKKKWQEPRGLVWQCGAVAVCDHHLNCQSGGLKWLVSILSQVGIVPKSGFSSFLAWAFVPNCMNSSGVSIHSYCFHVNGHHIK